MPIPTAGPSAAAAGPVIGQWHELLWHDGLGRIVLVNGGPERGGDPDGPVELWAWDGRSWASLDAGDDGPTWRNFGVTAYDPERDVIVLHAGAVAAQTPSDETWEWDRRAWRLAGSGGPGAREGAAMAFDPRSRRMILFSGAVDGQVLGDTWAYDGDGWARIAETGPRPRFPALLDAAESGLVLYGGHVIDDPDRIALADTWTWDGTRWTEMAAESPPGERVNTASAIDPATGRLLLIGGGAEDGTAGDAWAWNGSTWSTVAANAFPGRQSAGAELDPTRKVIVMTGGIDRPGSVSPFQDAWEWSGNGAATRVWPAGN